jgi:hypothetical protein
MAKTMRLPATVLAQFRAQGRRGGKLGGSAGGLKAAANMTPAQRQERARKAGLAGAKARAQKAKARS